jgi:lipoprotein signal peptidase
MQQLSFSTRWVAVVGCCLTLACSDSSSPPSSTNPATTSGSAGAFQQLDGGTAGTAIAAGSSGSGNAGTAGSSGVGTAGTSGAGGYSGTAGSSGIAGQAGSTANSSKDEQIFEKMLAGEIVPAQGMAQIARSGGFPIKTPQGYIFARLSDAQAPYQLAGDHQNWQLQTLKLQNGIYWDKIPIANPVESKYKFVDGQGNYTADPWALRFQYDQFGEISLVEANSAHLERLPLEGTANLPPRTLHLWLPSAPITTHLYVHDGQNLFDPEAIWGGWHLQENLGPSTLAIGIDNTPERMSEYTHVSDQVSGQTVGGLGDEYTDYIDQQIRPLIETRYGKPSKVGMMGSSLGGLISLYYAFRFPQRLDFVASLSGTVGWGSLAFHNPTIIELIDNQAGSSLPPVYLDSGGSPGQGCVDSDMDGIMDDSPDSSDNYCENEQLLNILYSHGYQEKVNVWYSWDPNAPHNEAAWAARVQQPLTILESLPLFGIFCSRYLLLFEHSPHRTSFSPCVLNCELYTTGNSTGSNQVMESTQPFSKRYFAGYFAGVFAVFFLSDQLSKMAVRAWIPPKKIIPLIPRFLDITWVNNKGIALGTFANAPESIRHPILLVVPLIVTLAMVGYLVTHWQQFSRWLWFAWILIISGALGNWLDRLRFREVTDFFRFKMFGKTLFVNNLADDWISLGIVLLFFSTLPALKWNLTKDKTSTS